jgi:hypothetical protein
MKVAVRTEKDLIHNVLERLDSGRHWVKHTPQRGDSFCITGALGYEVYQDQTPAELRAKASLRIQESIKKLYPHRRSVSIPGFNDDSKTHWKDVEAVLKDAMGER